VVIITTLTIIRVEIEELLTSIHLSKIVRGLITINRGKKLAIDRPLFTVVRIIATTAKMNIKGGRKLNKL
jgi:hypothetical protein